MTTKNGDMPAMPMAGNGIDTQEDWNEITAGGRFLPVRGLTKREMMATNIAHVELEFKSIYVMSEFIGREINQSDIIDLVNAAAECEAKFRVIRADALLAELERTK